MEVNDKVYFAETNFRNQRRRFGIKHLDRNKHVYVIGKTGMGKTTLLENMVIQDIQNGDGVGVVDPHGEFAQKMLDFVPKERINDVIYFNPADLSSPIGFNIMENVDPDKRHLVAAGLMGVFKKIWVDVWSARMEYILGNTVLALLEYPGSTLLSINRMLANKDFRKKVVNTLSDPIVKSFWVDEFAKYTDRYTQEALPAIQNKVGQFISNPLIRNIIGQPKSSFDMRDIMDKRKILIINLSKGQVGEENTRLLGAMLITRLYLGAMSRIEITREKDRPDFYLYVDEFQNFATESFANILSEARKYHLNLVLAHQYITQMDETVRDAVFGNVGTMITFRIGAADAEFLEKELSPEFMMNDIVNLGFAHVYLKLMIDGVASRPFSATTLPPMKAPAPSYREEIIDSSREHFSRPRKEIEDIIVSSLNEKEGELQPREGERQQRVFSEDTQRKTNGAEPITVYEATCDVCGKRTLVPFIPDGKRPIFCKEHRRERPQQTREERPQQRYQERPQQNREERLQQNYQERPPQRREAEERPFVPRSPRMAQTGTPSIKTGETVLRTTPQEQRHTLSLKDLAPKKGSLPKGPDIEGLRKALGETLNETDDEEEIDVIEENENELEDTEPEEKIETEIDEQTPEEPETKEPKKDNIFRPGDTIKF